MRISKDKFPILDWLKKDTKEMHASKSIEVDVKAKEDILMWATERHGIINSWGSIKNDVIGNIDYVSTEFEKNTLDSVDMLSKIDIKILAKDKAPSGLLLFSTGTQVFYSYTEGYQILIMFRGKTLKHVWTNEGQGWMLTTNGLDADAYSDLSREKFIRLSGKDNVDERFNEVKKHNSIWREKASSSNKKHRDEAELNYFYVLISYIEAILLFKHYAKVETIHVKPKEKVKDPNSKENHVNASDIPINMLDCRWFNNIIRNEPFGVRGHFRLQPKKNDEGEWIKEMIYIKPFIKTGYNIKARKNL